MWTTALGIWLVLLGTPADSCANHECHCTWRWRWVENDGTSRFQGEDGKDGTKKYAFYFISQSPLGSFANAYAESWGPRAKANWCTFKQRMKVQIEHIKPCPACRESEGRIKAKGEVKMRGRAEVNIDEAGADAIALCLGETVITADGLLDIAAQTGAAVTPGGVITVGRSFTAGVDQGKPTLLTTVGTKDSRNKGTQHLDQNTGEARDEGEVEANKCRFQAAARTKIGAEAEGVSGWFSDSKAQAYAKYVTEEAYVTFDLSCDNCQHGKRTLTWKLVRTPHKKNRQR